MTIRKRHAGKIGNAPGESGPGAFQREETAKRILLWCFFEPFF
jgi:hypothetical protein